MTIPTAREAPGPDTGGWRLLEAINRVDDSVRTLTTDMASRFDRLDERFMPRREITARLEDSMRDRADLRSELAQEKTRRETDVEQLRTKHETDVERLEKAAQDTEERRQAAAEREAAARRAFRRWLIGTGLAAFSAIAGVIGGITVHFH